MNNHTTKMPKQWLIPAVFLTGLLLLSYLILQEFLLTLAWAFIIAYTAWPPYQWLRRRLNGKATLSAAVMTAIIAATITLTLYWLVAMLQNEIKLAYQALAATLSKDHYELPGVISRIPWLGHYLQEWLDRINDDRMGMTKQLIDWAKQWLGQFAQFIGGVGRYVMNLGFVLVTVFFCFRDGKDIIRQLQQGLIHFLGEYQQVYLQAAGDTTRAVVYGIVLAALGQGIIAGFGYAVAGVQAPVLFATITALLALIPMGAMVVWLSIAIMLLASGQIWPGVGLLLWGFLAISTVDNVIRPIVISGASQVPFLVVMFGVFGGLSAFGVIGLFLGPVILSVLLAVWRAWLMQQQEGE
ncbi:MAG: AI-2E family transporter [Methylovulum sp.]|nr:AI-2E family transporter [Methylovulum sp.]